jgi:hypothetical protein
MEFPWSSLVYFMTCKDHRFPVAEVPAQETATPRWAWRVLMMNPPNAEKMFRKKSLFAGVIRCYTLIHSYTVIPWISKKYINILYSKLKTSVSWLAVRRSSRFMLSSSLSRSNKDPIKFQSPALDLSQLFQHARRAFFQRELRYDNLGRRGTDLEEWVCLQKIEGVVPSFDSEKKRIHCV